ncbi:hypothetical protein [Rhizobium lentis]|uniref:Uncharacterized protein n=1 Tax=Rhizobium lentis TaxID=1138194 RepID=A0ABS7IN31_9HYPH|nr:hypothetical protein [Rhizobium lentis]MBX4955369.1 hypothetical protein [Rhizobium lentis]MBX4973371.1 hypothetical protein [Rhizobium lentis]MBX4984676.1 hypothetical protein [Rhizobium lentis]MBX4999821.1 hypothetical protein [Rhizobium lentis]MBX5003121.1 hypothetical protein [Rhizobium lentis]
MRGQEATCKAPTGAGTPIGQVERTSADLVLDRRDEDRWEVTAMTPRGLAWTRDHFCCALRQSFNGSMCLDIMSADRLLKEAHAEGLTTEFVSLSGKDIY